MLRPCLSPERGDARVLFWVRAALSFILRCLYGVRGIVCVKIGMCLLYRDTMLLVMMLVSKMMIRMVSMKNTVRLVSKIEFGYEYLGT